MSIAHDTNPSATSLDRRKVMIMAAAAGLAARPDLAAAATATELSKNSQIALDRLYATRPASRGWGKKAKAILVFPEIVKAGFIIGGQGGDGALFEKGQPVGFFRIAAASFGLEAGAQTFSYALFMMTDKAVEHLKTSEGWSIGTGPTVVVLDEGAAESVTSTTMREDVYAVAYGQKGLMAGLSLEGSKISRIHPKA